MTSPPRSLVRAKQFVESSGSTDEERLGSWRCLCSFPFIQCGELGLIEFSRAIICVNNTLLYQPNFGGIISPLSRPYPLSRENKACKQLTLNLSLIFFHRRRLPCKIMNISKLSFLILQRSDWWNMEVCCGSCGQRKPWPCCQSQPMWPRGEHTRYLRLHRSLSQTKSKYELLRKVWEK